MASITPGPGIPLGLLVGVLLAVAPPAQAQSALQVQCVSISGVSSVSLAPGRSGCPGEVFITLSGSLEITPQQVTHAQVACWVCETGSCDANSPYGPALVEMPLDGIPDQSTMIAWDAEFRFNFEQPDGSVPPGFPSFSSYHCEVRVGVPSQSVAQQMGRGGDSMPFLVPEAFASDARARPLEGTSLVTQLSGVLPDMGLAK